MKIGDLMNELMEMTPNRSKTYLLPLIIKHFNIPENINHNFINCFIFDRDNFHDNCIYLLYKYDIRNPNFTKFEYELSKKKGYVTHYDLVDNLILFVLEIPEPYLDDYVHYIHGLYSHYSESSKQIILNYYYKKIPNNVYNKVRQILYKDSQLKLEIEKMLGVSLSSDSELGSILDDISETIDITKYNINYI